jgi:hypothetical protein
MAQRGGHLNKVLEDVCALANTNGGSVYVGVSANPKEPPSGVRDTKASIDRLQTEIANHITPEPDIQIDSLPSQKVQVIRITVQPGGDSPYAIDDNKFYVRDEAETTLAVRDEIVRLVERGKREETLEPITVPNLPPVTIEVMQKQARNSNQVEPPRTGVEVVSSDKRDGTYYHTVRDLRNGNLIKNVTRSSARKLWHYAITQVEEGQPKEKDIQWKGNIALLNERQRDDNSWYDLALRGDGDIHIYYGVTDSGLNEDWMSLISQS